MGIFPEIGSHVRGNCTFFIEHSSLKPRKRSLFDEIIEGILGFDEVLVVFDSTEIGVTVIETVGPVTPKTLGTAEGRGASAFCFSYLALVKHV